VSQSIATYCVIFDQWACHGLPRKQIAEDLGVGFFTHAKWIQKSRSADELSPQV